MYDDYMDNNNSNDSGNMWGAYSAGGNSQDDYSSNDYSNDSYSNDSYSGAYSAGNSSPKSNNGANEDSLLSQIDAFRDKAEKLQNMMNEREQQMGGYQGGYSAGPDISRELDRMIQSVNASISAITSRLNQQDSTLSNIESRLSSQDGTLSGIDSRLSSQDGTLMGIENKLTQQDGTLANIDNRLSMQDSQMAAQPAVPVAAPVSEELKGQLDGISGDISKLSADTRSMQEELSEKIHSENVKVYRNLNDVIKENDGGEENKNEIIKKIKSVKTSANLALIFGIFDFAGIGALVYLMLKMTGML